MSQRNILTSDEEEGDYSELWSDFTSDPSNRSASNLPIAAPVTCTSVSSDGADREDSDDDNCRDRPASLSDNGHEYNDKATAAEGANDVFVTEEGEGEEGILAAALGAADDSEPAQAADDNNVYDTRVSRAFNWTDCQLASDNDNCFDDTDRDEEYRATSKSDVPSGPGSEDSDLTSPLLDEDALMLWHDVILPNLSDVALEEHIDTRVSYVCIYC